MRPALDWKETDPVSEIMEAACGSWRLWVMHAFPREKGLRWQVCFCFAHGRDGGLEEIVFGGGQAESLEAGQLAAERWLRDRLRSEISQLEASPQVIPDAGQSMIIEAGRFLAAAVGGDVAGATLARGRLRGFADAALQELREKEGKK